MAAPAPPAVPAQPTVNRPALDDATEGEAWALLLSVRGLGPVGFAALLSAFGSGLAVIEGAGRRRAGARIASIVAEGDGRPPPGVDLAAEIVAFATTIPQRLRRLRAAGVAIVTLDDEAYPDRLRAIEQPPPVLFVTGSLESLAAAKVVAIVGTRHPTEHGRTTAARIAAVVAAAGGTVVSGLAVGIDGAAHSAAVHVPAPTVAVLGSGHRHLFPRSHDRLAAAIVATGGGMISEFWPDDPPTSFTFPRRNRVIAGLSDATIVVEAGATSGALITARWALEQGRKLFLVPGRLDDPESAGCLRWLREFPGEARIVAGVSELIEDLGLLGVRKAVRRRGPGARGLAPPPLEAVLFELGQTARDVGAALVAGHGSLDELVAVTGYEPATVLGAITLLELRGLATSTYGRYRAAGRLASAPPTRNRSGR